MYQETFKSTIFHELREDMEIADRDGKEPFVCRFLREEKEKDVRLLVRRDRQKLLDARDGRELALALETMLQDMLDAVKENPKCDRRCRERDRLLALLGFPRDASLKNALQNALRQKTYEREAEKEKQEERRHILSEAAKQFIGLCGGESANPYIRLMAAYLDYGMREVTPEELLETAKKIYKKSYKTCGDTRQILAGRKEPGDPEKAVRDLASAILRREAEELLYNNENRSRNRSLDLVSSYCDDRGITAGARAGAIAPGPADVGSDEFKRNALDIFWNLKEDKDKAQNVCLPLILDERTGAGIFIIGQNHLPESAYEYKSVTWDEDTMAQIRASCCNFCYMSAAELMKTEADYETDYLEMIYDVEICETIEEAIHSYKTGRLSAYDCYAEMNGTPPDHVAERFLPYFEKPYDDI